MTSRLIWILAGLLIGLLFLALSLSSIDVAASLRATLDAKPFYVMMALAASIGFMVVKTWRWKVILTPIGDIPVSKLLAAVCAGTAVNLIVSHAGEFVRAATIGRRHGLPTSALLGSIAIERLFDTVAVLAFLGVLALSTESLPSVVLSASYAAALIVAVTFAAVVVALLSTEATLRLVEHSLAFLSAHFRNKILWHLRSAIEGLGAMRDARLLHSVILLSLLQWACILVGIFASVRSMGLTTDAVSAIAVLILLVVGLTLPAAPANVGTTQLGFTIGLAAFHVSAPDAFAASVIYTLFVLVPMMVMGVVTFSRTGLGWRSILADLASDAKRPSVA